MRRVTLEEAENFVANNKNAYFEGWEVIVHRPNPGAEYSANGSFNRETGLWGFNKRVAPNDKGAYTLPR